VRQAPAAIWKAAEEHTQGRSALYSVVTIKQFDDKQHECTEMYIQRM
jgi:hypothetical protein